MPDLHLGLWQGFAITVLETLLSKEEPIIIVSLAKHFPDIAIPDRHKLVTLSIPKEGMPIGDNSIVGSRVFTQVNDFLRENNQTPIIW